MPEMYTFYYQPSAEQEAAGYTYKFNFNDVYGVNPTNWHQYTFTRTPLKLDGIFIYSVSFPKDYEKARIVQYQVYNGDNWVSQVEFNSVKLEELNNKVVRHDGSYKSEDPTQAPTTQELTTEVSEPVTTQEPATTSPATEAYEETTIEATEETTVAVEETTTAIIETTEAYEATTIEETTAPESETVTFSYLPSKEQAQSGYSFKLAVHDETGKFTTYELIPSDEIVDGITVYKASVNIDKNIITLYYQVYDNDNWVSQISVPVSEAESKVIKYDGTAIIEPTTAVTTIPETISYTPATSAPAEETTAKPAAVKKPNPIKVSVKTKTIKAKKLKAKKQKIKPFTVKKAQGKVTYKLVKNGTTKTIYKKLSIKSGAITFKKGAYAKKTYKIKVKITAKGNSKYKSKSINKIVKVKIK